MRCWSLTRTLPLKVSNVAESEFVMQWAFPWWSFEGSYRADGFLDDIPPPETPSKARANATHGDASVFNYKRMRQALNTFRRETHSRPKLNGYPPSVFISYRWENAEAKRWVQQLAAYVRSRGFQVRS